MSGLYFLSAANNGNVIQCGTIETALMPPLCTSGYSLATLQVDFY